MKPAFQSLVTAWTKTFQAVTESGTVNAIDAEPSAPVRSCGFQNAVSAKLLRSAPGSAGAPTAADLSSFRNASTRDAGAGASGAAFAIAFVASASPDTVIASAEAASRPPTKPRAPGPPSAYPP